MKLSKTLVCCLMLVLSSLSTMAQTEQKVKYEKFAGKIGPYAITLFVNLEYADEDSEVGYYYYNDRPTTHFTLKLVIPFAMMKVKLEKAAASTPATKNRPKSEIRHRMQSTHAIAIYIVCIR